MKNELIAVDLADKKIGIISKEDAHKKGVLHRAFSIFLYHDGKMLLQQRAFGKYHSGGLWTNTCCSHPREDNLIGDAKQRLYEETGIAVTSLKEIFVFNYFTKFSDNMYEYEVDHVLVADYTGSYKPNKQEINRMKWVEVDWLAKDLVKNPQKYTSWFIIAVPRVIEYIKKHQKPVK